MIKDAIRRPILSVLLVACTMTGCAIAVNRTIVPPPSVDGVGGPIVARQIDDHTWRIYWDASNYTPFEDEMTREDYFLYRAARFTIDNGFDWFSLAGQHVQMFKGTAPPDVLGTYDAHTLMLFVGPRVLVGAPAAPQMAPMKTPVSSR